MRTAFNIVSISILLVLVSCQKDVIVPNDADFQIVTKRSTYGVFVDSSNDYSGDGEITDPNDRNLRVGNGADVSNRGNIVDPTDSGNTIVRKPKR